MDQQTDLFSHEGISESGLDISSSEIYGLSSSHDGITDSNSDEVMSFPGGDMCISPPAMLTVTNGSIGTLRKSHLDRTCNTNAENIGCDSMQSEQIDPSRYLNINQSTNGTHNTFTGQSIPLLCSAETFLETNKNGVVVNQIPNGLQLSCGGMHMTQDMQQFQQQLQEKILSSAAASLPLVSLASQQYVLITPLSTNLAPILIPASQTLMPISAADAPIPMLHPMNMVTSLPSEDRNTSNTLNSSTVVLDSNSKPISKLTKAPQFVQLSSSPNSTVFASQATEDLTDLEGLEKFAKYFKQRRIELGFTQGDVGAAIGKSYQNDFSQTTISRFEALNLSFKNMCKIKTLLQQWLQEQENKQSSPVSDSFCGHVSPEGISSKRRKRRTTIEDNVRDMLEKYFATNSKPNTQQLTKLAEEHNLERDVIRVWFCNRRQKEKRINCSCTLYGTTLIPCNMHALTTAFSPENMDSQAIIITDNKIVNDSNSPKTTNNPNDPKEMSSLSAAMLGPKGAIFKGFAKPLIFTECKAD